MPGRPSGLGWTPGGALLVASMTARTVLRLDGGTLTSVADVTDETGWYCNDMMVDEQGRAYVGNFDFDDEADPTLRTTALLRVDPDGSTQVAAADVVFPNGMAITPDGGTLLLAETFAARITAFDRKVDGTLGSRRVWAEFTAVPLGTTTQAREASVPLPDGIALDAEGALWIGDACGDGALRAGSGVGSPFSVRAMSPGVHSGFRWHPVSLSDRLGILCHAVSTAPLSTTKPRTTWPSASSCTSVHRRPEPLTCSRSSGGTGTA